MALVIEKIDRLVALIDECSSKNNAGGCYRIVTDPNDKGGPEKLLVESFDLDDKELSLSSNEVLIQVKAVGVNFIDTYHRSGLYPNPSNRIGGEGSGTIIKIGSNVSNFNINDNVCWFGLQGSYSTHVKTDATKPNLVKIPTFLTEIYPKSELFEIAAAVPAQCLTCHYLCCDTVPGPSKSLSAETTPNILVHAGAGGCGGLLIQMLKNVFGVTNVLTTVSSDYKAQLARSYGADAVIVYTRSEYLDDPDSSDIGKNGGPSGFARLKKDVLDACVGGSKCQVVFDGVGRSTWKLSLEVCERRGMVVYFGNASGKVPPVDPLALVRQGSVYMTRPTLKDYVSTREETEYRMNDVFDWIREGKVNIKVGQKVSLRKATEAHQMLEARKTVGKIVLIP